MGKIQSMSGNDICKILLKHGFLKVRQKGSHVIMQKRFESTTITIPVPNHPEIKPGTLHSIIRQSGLSKDVFQK